MTARRKPTLARAAPANGTAKPGRGTKAEPKKSAPQPPGDAPSPAAADSDSMGPVADDAQLLFRYLDSVRVNTETATGQLADDPTAVENWGAYHVAVRQLEAVELAMRIANERARRQVGLALVAVREMVDSVRLLASAPPPSAGERAEIRKTVAKLSAEALEHGLAKYGVPTRAPADASQLPLLRLEDGTFIPHEELSDADRRMHAEVTASRRGAGGRAHPLETSAPPESPDSLGEYVSFLGQMQHVVANTPEEATHAEAARVHLTTVLQRYAFMLEGNYYRTTQRVPRASTWWPDTFDHILEEDLKQSGMVDGTAPWVRVLLALGARAVIDATSALITSGDISLYGSNVVTALGNLVSMALRRSVLLHALDQNNWNLAHTAKALRIAHGAPTVIRLIKDLGLQTHYDQAKAAGRTQRGRPVPKKSPA